MAKKLEWKGLLEGERDKRLHSPFALHASRHQAIWGGGGQVGCLGVEPSSSLPAHTFIG